MAVVLAEVRRAVRFPVGANVLRNDAAAALALAAACAPEFIRVNVHTGASVTDQGLVQGRAHQTLRRRDRLWARAADAAPAHLRRRGRQARQPLGPTTSGRWPRTPFGAAAPTCCW